MSVLAGKAERIKSSGSNKVTYVIDTKTKNLSFLKMHRYLRDRGIQNNKFFLRLYDKDLIGVDPYSKKLTRAQELKIINECTKNPFFYLREIARVRIPLPFFVLVRWLAFLCCLVVW